MSRVIPTINTARVTLRSLMSSDFERYAELWADPCILDQIGVAPYSRDEAWSAFLRNAGHWQVAGYGQWGIERHRAGRIAGLVGFFNAARGYGDDFDAHPEAGWLMAPETQALGLGAEAAIAAHEWYDRIITGPLVCRVAATNTASRGLADRLGYATLREIEAGARVLMIRKSPPPGDMT